MKPNWTSFIYSFITPDYNNQPFIYQNVIILLIYLQQLRGPHWHRASPEISLSFISPCISSSLSFPYSISFSPSPSRTPSLLSLLSPKSFPFIAFYNPSPPIEHTQLPHSSNSDSNITPKSTRTPSHPPFDLISLNLSCLSISTST